ncbi:MAG: nicotinate (nicotinamide) nucleotide adenylyltransferase [Candidatus Faecousia sp.]|nr:nicotinate (nicotinamide) nucleotide adenylyltransferase [Candidatus Faecousia sp.]
MERIGVYGGTFNPPHTGHIHGAVEAIRALRLDRLILIPAHVAPHKELPEGSPEPEQRLEMVKLAAAPFPEIEVSDMELKREGTSYTYQTILELRERYPDAKLFLLMGTDMFLAFENWAKPELIVANATIAVLYRGEKGERDAIATQKEHLENMGARVKIVSNEVLDISSTQLRRLLAFRCAAPFLPNGVGAYIRANGLYDSTADWKNLPMEQLEPVVVKLLNPNRVAHVLGCRDTAVKMALRWGANPADAARAGILHDITKALDGPLQLTLCAEYGTILDEFGQKNPKTLHALTGALVAERIFGEKQEVVSAIRNHTTGKANMTLLEKIVYVADYMEPCRNFPGVEKLRELAFSDLDGALRLGLQMTLENLANRALEVSPESREALAYLDQTERKEKKEC